MFEMELKK